MPTDGTSGTDHHAAVGNRQRVAGSAVTDLETAVVVPDGTGTGHDHGVIAGDCVQANDGAGVDHKSTVGDGQRVGRTGVTDDEEAAIAPDRAGIGDEDAVVVGIGVVADDATKNGLTIEHGAAIGNRQRITGTVETNVKVAAVAPDRITAGDSHGVVEGVGVKADDTTKITTPIEHGAAIGNRQRIARTVVADDKVSAVVPDRAGAGDEDAVVAGSCASANRTKAVEHGAAVGNRQRIAGAQNADAENVTVIPDGVAAGNQNRIAVAGIANGAVGVKYKTAIGDN